MTAWPRSRGHARARPTSRSRASAESESESDSSTSRRTSVGSGAGVSARAESRKRRMIAVIRFTSPSSAPSSRRISAGQAGSRARSWTRPLIALSGFPSSCAIVPGELAEGGEPLLRGEVAARGDEQVVQLGERAVLAREVRGRLVDARLELGVEVADAREHRVEAARHDADLVPPVRARDGRRVGAAGLRPAHHLGELRQRAGEHRPEREREEERERDGAPRGDPQEDAPLALGNLLRVRDVRLDVEEADDLLREVAHDGLGGRDAPVLVLLHPDLLLAPGAGPSACRA